MNMNTKHLLTASLIGGLLSIVLANTPYLNLINVLLCAGFWIGPIAAVGIYRRQAGAVTLAQAVLIGILAGAWHALFGLLLSPIGLAGAGGILKDVQPLLSADDQGDALKALTGVNGVLLNLVGSLFDIVFGFLGGLVGGAIFGAHQTTAQ
jgi:hypothetical protein